MYSGCGAGCDCADCGQGAGLAGFWGDVWNTVKSVGTTAVKDISTRTTMPVYTPPYGTAAPVYDTAGWNEAPQQSQTNWLPWLAVAAGVWFLSKR